MSRLSVTLELVDGRFAGAVQDCGVRRSALKTYVRQSKNSSRTIFMLMMSSDDVARRGPGYGEGFKLGLCSQLSNWRPPPGFTCPMVMTSPTDGDNIFATTNRDNFKRSRNPMYNGLINRWTVIFVGRLVSGAIWQVFGLQDLARGST